MAGERQTAIIPQKESEMAHLSAKRPFEGNLAVRIGKSLKSERQVEIFFAEIA